jgi:two-component system chemotaxis response regulator CheB
MTDSGKKIRVMVVDDSALMRKMISSILMKDPELEVVSTAMDGVFALKKLAQVRPDVITLDLEMPRMDGLTTLRYIVDDFQIPVVLVSSHSTEGGDLTLQGLALGAVDFIAKPREAVTVHLPEIALELIQKVKTASRVTVRKMPRQALSTGATASVSVQPKRQSLCDSVRKVIAIGVSTGGPNAISAMLPQLPEDLPAAILIVQHMPEGFTQAFANRLNHACRIRVQEASDGAVLREGAALIAPGNRHLRVARLGKGAVAVISSSPPVNGHRPSVDVLFTSVAEVYGPDCVGLIMTGMGEDGARGLGVIKAAGGYTVAQNEESCVVFGMPKVAIEMGHVQEVCSLEEIPQRLTALAKGVTDYAGSAKTAV